MPDTQTSSTIPKPIADVLRHHGALQTAYVSRRAGHNQTEAFVGAVSDVLSESEVSDLSHLIAGSYDASYDSQRGAEFGQLLLDDLEQGYQDVRRIRDHAQRWRHLDAAGVVAALASDLELATLFALAIDEHNDTTARALVTSAVRTVVEKASSTGNAPATRRGVEAAATVHRHATNGLGETPQLMLLDHAADADADARLAAWCEALHVGLSAAL